MQPLQLSELNGFSWASDQSPRSADLCVSSEQIPAGGSGFDLGGSADVSKYFFMFFMAALSN